MTVFSPGDWVQIYAQVSDPQPTHSPEEIVVDLFSKTEQYKAHVLAGRCVYINPPVDQGIAQRCNSLTVDDLNGDRLIRCEKHLNHSFDHRCGDEEWDDMDSLGYIEEKE